jgi:hypothetical protein
MKLFSGYVYKKHKWLGPISKISHYVYANIPKSEEKKKNQKWNLKHSDPKHFIRKIQLVPIVELKLKNFEDLHYLRLIIF